MVAPNPLRVCSCCLGFLEEGSYCLSEMKTSKVNSFWRTDEKNELQAAGELPASPRNASLSQAPEPRQASLSQAPEPRSVETPKRSLSTAPPPPSVSSTQRGSLAPKEAPKTPKSPSRTRTESKSGNSSNEDTDDEESVEKCVLREMFLCACTKEIS